MTESTSAATPPAIGLGGAARDLYRALWLHAKGVRPQMLGAAELLSGAQLMRLTTPWLAAQAINALQQGDMATAGWWIAYLIGIYLLSWLLHGPGRVPERNVRVRVRLAPVVRRDGGLSHAR